MCVTLKLSPALLLLLGAALTLAGCRSNIEVSRLATVAQATAPTQAIGLDVPSGPPPAPPPRSLELPLASLTPTPGGKGIVVCEPVAQQTDAATADFGAGCGRWLCYTVGGQPELGRTPLWSEIQRVQEELNKTNLRLSLSDALTLGEILGVTHIAVGTIKGTPAHCTLTYQLWAVSYGRAVGGPLRASGTQVQVIAALPVLARQMARSLGVAAPRVPPTVGAGPADLSLAGQVPWGPADSLSATSSEEAALQTLAAHWPLAALLALNVDLRWHPTLPIVAHALLTQSPDNPFGYAQLGYVRTSGLRPFAGALAARRRLFPKNYGWAHTDVWWERDSKNTQAELMAAKQAVQDAPADPDAWLTLGYTLSEEAELLRNGRTADALSVQEWQALNQLYPQWLAAVSHAARLDPRYGKAWQRVAQAATFAGDTAVADTAFWNALRYDTDHSEVYSWGLQMYQQKWGGDPVTLAKVAALAASDHYATVPEAVTVAGDLVEAGFADQAKSLMDRYVAAARAAVQRTPTDAKAHWELAEVLKQQRPAEAVLEYQAAIRFDPDNADLHHDLAETLNGEQSGGAALGEYQAAVRLNPTNAQWHFDYGWELKHLGQIAEAERQMRLAVQLDPRNAEGHYGLAVIMEETHRPAEAISEYQRASLLSPFMPDVPRHLISLLDSAGRYDEALVAGRRGLEATPNDSYLLDDMADCCLHKKQWQTSIAYSQQALQVNTNDALAHLNLGEAYIGQGEKDAARAEWQLAASMDHGQFGQDARELLAKHP